MDYSNLFTKYQIDKDKLLEKGFIALDKYKNKNNFKKEIPFHNDEFLLQIIICDKKIELEVYEMPQRTLYLPFKIKNNDGAFIGEIKEEVDNIISEIVNTTFNLRGIKEKLVKHVKEKYHIDPIEPWGSDKGQTLNCINGKWFGLFINIPYKSIHIEKEGKIDVLNIKLEPSEIEELLSEENKYRNNFVPAYHMNKKHWITIILDEEVDIDLTLSLLDKSFSMVNK